MVEDGQSKPLRNSYREARRTLAEMRDRPTYRVTPADIAYALRLTESINPRIRDLARATLDAVGYY
ncbi:MAG: hypothetical protein HYS80_01255 [Candidatus Aenigmarchaeota archaeon]|nr:hypothetical protein [Candidatus Aenigmarchaeota archaeon]